MAANRLKLNADKTELLWAGSKYGSTLLKYSSQVFVYLTGMSEAGQYIEQCYIIKIAM